jgi:type III restriction enzyme
VRADGDLSNYVPDFFVRDGDGAVYVIETKGREELELPQKMARLKQWCQDATSASRASGGAEYRFVYVDQEGFERSPPRDLAGLLATFREYQ